GVQTCALPIYIDRQIGEIRRPAAHDDVVDIAVMFGDHLRYGGEGTRLVDGVEGDPGGKTLPVAVLHRPAHVEPAVGCILEGGEGGRLDGVDRDAFARRQDADDAVSRHGAALRCEAHRQVAVE